MTSSAPSLHALIVLLTGALLALAGGASAQEIRLDDVLTTATLQRADGTEPLVGDAARLLLRQTEEDLDAGEAQRAADASAVLVFRIPEDDPLHIDALWLRTRAYRAAGLAGQAAHSAREYIMAAPQGAEVPAARFIVGKALMDGGEPAEAAREYREAIAAAQAGAKPPSATDLLAAAEAFLKSGDPATCRDAIALLGTRPLSPGQQALRAHWLLDSLLVSDDRTIPVPAELPQDNPLYAPVSLRRALLLETRGGTLEARPLYEALHPSRRHQLGEAELAILERRLLALSEDPLEQASGKPWR